MAEFSHRIPRVWACPEHRGHSRSDPRLGVQIPDEQKPPQLGLSCFGITPTSASWRTVGVIILSSTGTYHSAKIYDAAHSRTLQDVVGCHISCLR